MKKLINTIVEKLADVVDFYKFAHEEGGMYFAYVLTWTWVLIAMLSGPIIGILSWIGVM